MLRRLHLTALLLFIPVHPYGTLAQTATYETDVFGSGYEDMAEGESRDVPCEYSLSPAVFEHYGVEFKGHMFLSEWRSIRSDFPLPSWNWYYALPNRNPISNDGKARWEDAQIQVHCWVYRVMYVIRHHRHHVASLGRLVELCEVDWEEDDDWEEIEVQASGDGGTAPNFTSSTICNGDGGGGGGGGDGGSTWRCYTVTIDHYLYYPDTGEVEYQYTEEYSYCEQVE